MLSHRLLAPLLLALALAAPPSLAQQPSDPPPLRIVTSFTIASMNPHVQGFWLHEFGVGEMLMQFRSDGAFHPWLAKSLDAVDPLNWRITLRPNVTFQNGRPVNAAAVVAAIQRQLANSPGARSVTPPDAKFLVTGEYDVTVKTDKPWPGLPGILSNEAFFLIYDAEAVGRVGDNWPALVNAGIYTGPYQVTGLDSARLQARRFDGYWQGRPALPGLTVSFVVDPNARLLAVQNNEADIALYPPSAVKVVVDRTPGLHFQTAPGTGAVMMFTHAGVAPMNDVRVRRALQYAINYKEIAEVVFAGQYETATGWYQSLFPWAMPNQATDVAKANVLLDQAGWARGSDGVRAKDGKRLSLTILIYPQQPDLVPLAAAIQNQLRAVGIAMETRSVEDSNAAILGGTVPWDGALLFNATTSWGAPEPVLNRYFTAVGDRNYGPYANKEIGALATELSEVADSARRLAALRRIQEIMVLEDPVAFNVGFIKGRAIVNDRYRNYVPGFALYHVSWQTRPAP